MIKKSNISSVSGKPSLPQSSKSTGQKQRITVISQTLLPTPSARDGRGSYGTPRDNIDCAIEVGKTKTSQYSLAASPASRSVTLDEEQERQTTATSGLICLQSLKTSDQTGSSLKTCVASLLGTTAWFSKQCALIWKAKVTKSNRLLFQLSPSVRRTEEIGFGLLPTTDANDGMTGATKVYDPQGKSQSSRTVATAVAHGTKTGAKLRLQPAMTEWMMGFPDGWTELPSVPPSTVKSD